MLLLLAMGKRENRRSSAIASCEFHSNKSRHTVEHDLKSKRSPLKHVRHTGTEQNQIKLFFIAFLFFLTFSTIGFMKFSTSHWIYDMCFSRFCKTKFEPRSEELERKYSLKSKSNAITTAENGADYSTMYHDFDWHPSKTTHIGDPVNDTYFIYNRQDSINPRPITIDQRDIASLELKTKPRTDSRVRWVLVKNKS